MQAEIGHHLMHYSSKVELPYIGYMKGILLVQGRGLGLRVVHQWRGSGHRVQKRMNRRGFSSTGPLSWEEQGAMQLTKNMSFTRP